MKANLILILFLMLVNFGVSAQNTYIDKDSMAINIELDEWWNDPYWDSLALARQNYYDSICDKNNHYWLPIELPGNWLVWDYPMVTDTIIYVKTEKIEVRQCIICGMDSVFYIQDSIIVWTNTLIGGEQGYLLMGSWKKP